MFDTSDTGLGRFRHPLATSVTEMFRLDGKSIAVTGGASGIGLATVEAVLALGARATIIDRSADGVDQAVADLSAAGYDVDGHVADVTDGEAIDQAMRAAVAHTGTLDGLVASAGTRMTFQPMTELPLEEWQRVLDVNLTGLFLTCKSVAKVMTTQRHGSIVTIGSLSGHAPRYHQSAYSVSKAGAEHLTRILALEVANVGVRVNCVSPGTTLTAMMETALETEGDQVLKERVEGNLDKHRGGIPLRRLSEPIDQAAAAVFLLSDAARHITGQSLLVDGGESLV
ncbi:SDR family NAD(P)-dependent oxidoreductase [Nocardia salmonicida]|uniref:SDR family NAD(P)-dependent oxidoreductase n=1 Tax=Nocardia salmonicida TaxID=53431 RepID=UPI0033E1C1B0